MTAGHHRPHTSLNLGYGQSRRETKEDKGEKGREGGGKGGEREARGFPSSPEAVEDPPLRVA